MALSATALTLIGSAASADIIHADDVIINGGSLCIGFDCANGESFGFDTLRLKENNLRLHFQDTSTSASFPSNDWRIVANDTSNGGGNYLAIEDSTASRQVFRVDAGAPANSLRVDSGGDLGIGTANPVTDIHVKSGNTPTLRLEQDGSSGFGAQTWDVAGNEANFFIRDATNGSKLPFRIAPNTPQDTIHMFADKMVINDGGVNYDLRVESDTNVNALFLDGATGNVGIGTDVPVLPLHVKTTGSDAAIALQNGTSAANFNLNWAADDTFRMSVAGSGQQEFLMDASGNVTITGTLTQSSDKNAKMAIEPVDAGDILQKVAALPVSSWTYIHDAETGVRHIGPMAQDFYAAFGTGATNKGISTLDTSGVALAAIQAQQALIERLSARIQVLESSRITAN